MSIGVDEAGRGCAIGCLFVAAAAFKEEDLDSLRYMGVVDSKKLTRARREELAATIKKLAAAVEVVAIEPSVIDSMNLNLAEAEAVKKALKLLVVKLRVQGYEVARVVVDLFGPRRLVEGAVREACPEAELILEHDADEKFVECSAASIVAKVLRDRHIDELKRRLGDFGSGYPSDRKTEEWIRRYYEEHGSLPDCVRRTWRTVKQAAPSEYKPKPRRAPPPPHTP